MSPSGRKLLPSGLEPAALRPSGSNLRPSGDIIFGPRAATFPVSRGRGVQNCYISVCERGRETEKGPEAEERGHGKGGTRGEGNLIFFHSIFMTQLRLTFEAEQGEEGLGGGAERGGVAEF